MTPSNTQPEQEMKRFASTFRTYKQNPMEFPLFTGTRLMMMPVVIGMADQEAAPQYRDFLAEMYGMVESRLLGQIGYLTIDEQRIKKGETLSRPGAHVDGIYKGDAAGWGGGGVWGGGGNGMMLVSSTPHCRMYPGLIGGWPGDEGGCEHLIDEDTPYVDVVPNRVYWCDPLCVHASLPVAEDTMRQFVRLSLPSDAPWFDGYTKNPNGTKPSGRTLPARREHMSFKPATPEIAAESVEVADG